MDGKIGEKLDGRERGNRSVDRQMIKREIEIYVMECYCTQVFTVK